MFLFNLVGLLDAVLQPGQVEMMVMLKMMKSSSAQQHDSGFAFWRRSV
jgi:hypothetical protein